jgi:formiminotetrahydrofolate cyclodeaminase
MARRRKRLVYARRAQGGKVGGCVADAGDVLVADADGRAGGLVVRGVGALAADMVAHGAELVAVLARQAGQGAAAAQAHSIHARAAALSVSNELAFTRAVRELDASIGGQGDEFELTRALARAAGVPLQVCQVASDLVLLAAELAAGSLSGRAADLAGVAQLASGACSATACLVRANLTVGHEDPRRTQADVTAVAATEAARRLLDDLAVA